MARPKKDGQLRHTHQIMLRLTDTEYEIVAENAKSANLTLAEYARNQIMNKTKANHRRNYGLPFNI